MTTQELRELDAWISEHVMGWKKIDRRKMGWLAGDTIWDTGDPADPTYTGFVPTIFGEAAMLVLKKCAEKICDKWDETNCIQIQFWDLEWHIADSSEDSDLPPAKAETLELAICLFAKQLFSQTTK